MAVGNSLANRQQKTGLTAYLTNDAVKNQINNVVGGKKRRSFHCFYCNLQYRLIQIYRNVQIHQS